jgi:hypothetical protein
MTTLRLCTRLAIGLTPIAAAFVLIASGNSSFQFRVRDRCDPATFNLAGIACIGDGNVTLARFSAELAKDMKVDAWRYDSDKDEVDSGATLQLDNQGGELHTFTKVAEFGGGFVPPLNAASGNPVPRPECAQLLPGGGIIPQLPSATNIFLNPGKTTTGPVAGSPILPKGTVTKFQCCVHPWMRVELTAK